MPGRNRNSLPDNPDEADAPRLGVVLDFMRLLWAVDHRLQSLSKRMNAQLGVTGPQRLVVRVIGKYPGVSAGRVASILHIDKSTLSGVLKRLEDRRLITRSTDGEDARRSHLRLTDRGTALDATRSGTVEAAARRSLAQVSADDIAAARTVLEVLAAELGADCEG